MEIEESLIFWYAIMMKRTLDKNGIVNMVTWFFQKISLTPVNYTSHMIKVMILSIVSFLKDFFSSRFYLNHNTNERCNIWCRSVLFWLSYFYWFSGKHKFGCGSIKYWIKWTKWLFSNIWHTSWYVSLIYIFLLFLFRNNIEAVICLSCAIPALFLFLFNRNLWNYKEHVLY